MSRKNVINGCSIEIGKLAGELQIDPKEILEEVELELQKIRNTQEALPNSEVGKLVGQRVTKNIREAYLIQKRNAQINNIIKQDVLESVQKYVDETGEDVVSALKSINVGSNNRVAGSRLSVDARQRAVSREFIGELLNRLRKEDLDELVSSSHMDKDIAIELWELRDGGNVGSTKNLQAQKAAGIIRDLQQKVIARSNEAGAWIKETAGYIIKQSHNKERILKAGYEKWKTDILPLLDTDLMAKRWGLDSDEFEDFLHAAFTNITTGREFKFGKKGKFNPLSIAFKAPANRAGKLSAERIFEFKDAEGWWSYHTNYGHGGILDNVVSNLERAGEDIGLMERWGTNPDYMFERVKQELANSHRDNPKVYNALTGKKAVDLLDFQWKEITGATRAVSSVTLARVSSEIRAVESMSKLGMATLSSFADLVSRAAELNYHGVGLLESYGKGLSELTKGRGDAETRELMDLIGVGFDGMMGDVFTRFHSTDSSPGFFTNMLGKYFKLNALNWWTDANMSGTVRILSADLAKNRKSVFTNLSKEKQNALRIYDIDGNDWDILRKHAIKEASGREYMVTDGFGDIPTDTLKAAFAKRNNIDVDTVTTKQIEKYRTDLETRLRTYFIDSAEYAVPTPSAKEKAIMNMGTHRGTVVGEAMRFVMQFKAFPVTYITKAFGRSIYGSENKGAMLKELTHLVVGMTAMGYLAMSAKDLVKGKEPKDPRSAKVFLEAFLQGGGAGIFADILLADTNRFGQGALATMMGPTFASAEDVYRTFGAYRDTLLLGEDVGKANLKAFRTTVNHMPGINLFYTRLALDYLFLWGIQEQLNSGYTGRLENKAYKDYEQEYWLPPTDALWR